VIITPNYATKAVVTNKPPSHKDSFPVPNPGSGQGVLGYTKKSTKLIIIARLVEEGHSQTLIWYLPWIIITQLHA
jgi:hypothetical protein